MAHRKRAEQISSLRHESYSLGEQLALCFSIDSLALEADLAAARNQHAEQRLENGRFARAVWPDQQRDLALAGVERQLVEDRDARRISGDDSIEFDDALGHGGLLDRIQLPAQLPTKLLTQLPK